MNFFLLIIILNLPFLNINKKQKTIQKYKKINISKKIINAKRNYNVLAIRINLLNFWER